MTNDDRRAEISAVHFANAQNVTILNIPNRPLTVTGVFTNIKRLSRMSFEEVQETNIASQKFHAISSDTSVENRSYMESLCRIPLVLSIEYTNGVRKVVGNKERPVFLFFACGGNPLAYTLSFQRNDARPAPSIQSF